MREGGGKKRRKDLSRANMKDKWCSRKSKRRRIVVNKDLFILMFGVYIHIFSLNIIRLIMDN